MSLVDSPFAALSSPRIATHLGGQCPVFQTGPRTRLNFLPESQSITLALDPLELPAPNQPRCPLGVCCP